MRRAVGTGLAVVLLAGGAAACGSDDPAPTAPTASTIFSTPPSVYEEQRAEGVSALLDALPDALTSADKGALDALIDPLATADFRRTWQLARANLGPTPPAARRSDSVVPSSPEAGAPSAATGAQNPPSRPSSAPAGSPSRGRNLVLKDLSYRLAMNSGPDRLIGGALGVQLTEAGSSDSWVSEVTLSYALGGAARPGVDEAVIEVPMMLAFSRYDDEWKLLGDGSVAPDPAVTPGETTAPGEPVPWTFSGLRARDVRTAGGASAVLSYPGTERTVGAVGTELASAVSAVSRFWGQDWSQQAVVVATATDEQFAALTRTRHGSTSAAAAASVFSRIDSGSKTVVGQRIVLAPAARQLSQAGIAVILRHELFHVAARLATAEEAPMWLTEGVAEYVGRRGTTAVPGSGARSTERSSAAPGASRSPGRPVEEQPAETGDELTDVAPELAVQVAAGRLPTDLPADNDFAVDTAQARLAYQTAWSFAAFVADTYGPDRLKQMYLAVAQGGDEPATAKALQQTLGASKKQLITEWQRWLRQEVR
ncbi:hypothetical protein GOHSU_01_00230 [Gordonia hirsuta DSM 44140 = NBRC 16056]|uniref:Peptidase MA-like domain-containing protein n=1 Tax=Gordonia hirsuta DSM 44140 = NBRC 16056 TaxID=1121927 RepID=L7L4H2_9ACTN|nr:hypothetical protein [Gordonia hirsuta]GAC55844.1 hypothetical protein GOHSU_01_00230 [Gordonia hirsuta DSM 44140 = NBRC 16056]